MLCAIITIFLCIHDVLGYIYPLAAEAQNVMQYIVDAAKKLCNFGCLVDMVVPEELEIPEPTFVESLLIWFGFKERPLKVEQEETYYLCTATMFTIFAVGFTIYMATSKRTNENKTSQALIRYLVEEQFQDSEGEYERSQFSLKCCPCPCTCGQGVKSMNASGDMK